MRYYEIRIYETPHQRRINSSYSHILAESHDEARRIASATIKCHHVTTRRVRLYPGNLNLRDDYEANGGLWATTDGVNWRRHNFGAWPQFVAAMNA